MPMALTRRNSSFALRCRAGAGCRYRHRIANAGAKSEMPLVRRVGNVIFANLVSLISAPPHYRLGERNGAVFKKSILERIYPLPMA